MMRSNIDELSQKLIAKYLQDYQNQIGQKEAEGNGSFVILDHETLQMILTFLFAHMGQGQSGTFDTTKYETKIDNIMDQQREQFDEIILKLEEKV